MPSQAEKETGLAAPKTKRKTTKAARPKVAKPSAPTSVPRRAIFVDVENTSSEADLVRAIESLRVDYVAQSTELTAVGNWRTAGQRVGRRLASLGARLVHSAPVAGVRDWSDLWIATAAGVWLGQARPGDTLEIISDDRAFDAVADVSLALGVTFHRISHRSGPITESSDAPEERPRPRSSRRRRRPSGTTSTPRESPRPPASSGETSEAHAAPPDAIHDLMTQLSAGRAGGWVNLDVLENALKASGFARPPGSARLVTRLHKLKDFEVSAHGKVRLVSGA